MARDRNDSLGARRSLKVPLRPTLAVADDYAAPLPLEPPRRAFLYQPQHASTRAGTIYRTLPKYRHARYLH